MSKTIETWDYQDGFVDGSNPEDYNGEFITGRTCVLAAGAPTMPDDPEAVADYYVIGVTQGVTLTQQKQIQRVMELGSKETILVPGASVGALQLQRVWYSGASLMKVLYRFVEERDEGTEEIEALANQPGYGDVYLNLASGLFDQPLGLVLTFAKQSNPVTEDDPDAGNERLGQIFLENCYIGNHGVSMTANAIVLAEQVSLQYERMIPVSVLG